MREWSSGSGLSKLDLAQFRDASDRPPDSIHQLVDVTGGGAERASKEAEQQSSDSKQSQEVH